MQTLSHADFLKARQQQVYPFQMMIYGAPKSRKTWWAMLFAEAGYNVIMADGERSSRIISQIDQTIREKITVLDLAGDTKNAAFSNFLFSFANSTQFTWNLDRKQVAFSSSNLSGDAGVTIDTSKLTSNDVLILDSWSALMDSLCLLYTSPSPRDKRQSRMPSSA